MYTDHPRQLRWQHARRPTRAFLACWSLDRDQSQGWRRRVFRYFGRRARRRHTTAERQLGEHREIDHFGGAAEAPATKADHFLAESLDPARVLQQQLLQFFRVVRELRVLKRHPREFTRVAATVLLKLYVSLLNNMQRLRCCSLGSTPVDAFEQHRQLRRRQMHRAGRDLWPHEPTALEAFREEAQPVSIRPQQLHEIPAPTTEDEHMSRVHVVHECRLNERCETVHATAQISRSRCQPDAGSRWRGNHARAARQSSTVRSVSASILPRRRMVLPAKSNSSSHSPATGAGRGTATVVTGTRLACGGARRGRPVCCTTQRRSRFAFSPWASAVAANDTPGCRHRRTSSRLASRSYTLRPLRRWLRTRFGTRSIAVRSFTGVHLRK